MAIAIILVFVTGYLLIALEHPIQINKAATALITGVLCWTLYALSEPGNPDIKPELSHHLADIAGILFFLIGAMTIVELVDAHQGFRYITQLVTTRNESRLLWAICVITFFLSAVLDNLTTAIVMVSLTRKLVQQQERRLLFAGMIIIAANAGGAWSPIGDVTTTMLWIGGQISAGAIVREVFVPSVVCLVVPLIILSFRIKGSTTPPAAVAAEEEAAPKGSLLMLIVGLAALISVPIFKTITHLPPYMGMLLGLSILWIVSELIDPSADEAERKPFTVQHALSRIDTAGILFFMGILLAVGALQSMGTLSLIAGYLDRSIGNNTIIISVIGVVSAIVDNVPLVAACMGMYSMEMYPIDSMLWEYLAYCAGTGGSLLVIGSAAGVAVMGMEKLDFIWYLKNITLLALAGYIGGAAVFILFA